MDDAAFFAVNSIVQDVFVLTISFNVNLVRPVVSGTITAKGEVRFASRSLWTAEATLYDAKGREIAFGAGNFSRSKVELMDVEGYRD